MSCAQFIKYEWLPHTRKPATLSLCTVLMWQRRTDLNDIHDVCTGCHSIGNGNVAPTYTTVCVDRPIVLPHQMHNMVASTFLKLQCELRKRWERSMQMSD